MSIGMKIGYSWYQLGRGDYLESFFSTIAYYLENKKWGSKYPYVMKKLYSGKISFEDAENIIQELKKIQIDLDKIDKSNNSIIWDARNLSIQVPDWAINPNDEVRTLKNYYVTADGRDLIGLMIVALKESKDKKTDLFIKSLSQETTSYF